MLDENKNLKDTNKESLKDTSSISISWQNNFRYYNKTNKLITALYMVTDIMNNNEPMRIKLRTLGTDILSDINSHTSLSDITLSDLSKKINTILSLLNITSDIQMISEMNCNILIKEFLALKESINESIKRNNTWLEEFISTESTEGNPPYELSVNNSNGHINISNNGQKLSYKTNRKGTRIGVQKGSTLMNALNKVSDKSLRINNENFEFKKDKRREEIISILKDRKNLDGIGEATITDIKNEAKGLLVSCGEKTLQRELVSMVKDNILKKTGEKRWSNYSLI